MLRREPLEQRVRVLGETHLERAGTQIIPGPAEDEDHARAIMRHEVARTLNFGATLTNHFVLDFGGAEVDFGTVAAPTLGVHGSQDPAFPPDHGQWLADHIPGARLLVLDKAGHEVPEGLWDVFVEAVLEHTSR